MEAQQNAQRVALVTGGTGGLGAAVTQTFLDRGCAVVVTYRVDAEAERLRAAVSAAARLLLAKADVTDSGQVADVVQQAVAELGRIDYLINLVGGWAGGAPLWETTAADW